MHETLILVPACLAGAALGVVFFGGLWWTVRKGVASKQPALWFLGSLLVRLSVTLAGFWLVGFWFTPGTNWARMAACLIGFVLSRGAVTRLSGAHAARASQGAGYAP